MKAGIRLRNQRWKPKLAPTLAIMADIRRETPDETECGRQPHKERWHSHATAKPVRRVASSVELGQLDTGWVCRVHQGNAGTH